MGHAAGNGRSETLRRRANANRPDDDRIDRFLGRRVGLQARDPAHDVLARGHEPEHRELRLERDVARGDDEELAARGARPLDCVLAIATT